MAALLGGVFRSCCHEEGAIWLDRLWRAIRPDRSGMPGETRDSKGSSQETRRLKGGTN
jgi:hypothetical protein